MLFRKSEYDELTPKVLTTFATKKFNHQRAFSKI